MPETPITVRPLRPGAEYDQQFLWAEEAFGDNSPEEARQWQAQVVSLPEFRPEQLRGTFRGDVQIGGCIIYERTLRMGAARLSVGCIGMVVTAPTQRRTGAAAALLRDAAEFALQRGHALLLLDGIPRFYAQFGYADMFDMQWHDVSLAALNAAPAHTCAVRPATEADAATLVDFYDRHFGPFAGSFTRSVAQQEHRLRHRPPELPVLVAIAPDGTPRGYVIPGADPAQPRVGELAADDGDATLALLRAVVDRFTGETPAFVRCYLPPQGFAALWLSDHLIDPTTPQDVGAPETWAVRTTQFQHHNAAWQAALTNLDALATALLPEWQTLWRASLAHWTGDLALAIGSETFALHIEGADLALADPAAVPDPSIIRLAPQAFVQTLCGYRSLDWAAMQPGNQIPRDLLPMLRILFPPRAIWIPRTDWF
jgi:predicted N-acetyltransferase YhbS